MDQVEGVSRLRPLIDQRARLHGPQTAIPGLMLSRFLEPSAPLAIVQHPVYSMVAQGSKEALIGGGRVHYRPGDALIAGVDLPVTSRIVEASPEQPYLAISLALDFRLVADLLHDQGGSRSAEPATAPFAVMDFDQRLTDPLIRLLDLLDRPEEIPVLAPLITREIVWRLLQGPSGDLLRRLAWPDGDIARIGRATRWIQAHSAEPLRVADLAERVNMSIASFHRHFKAVTSVTPLQFQKQVRLHQARNRLIAAGGVSEVAFDVGYDSLSQFNRDYKKLYGRAPSRDIAVLKGAVPAAAPPR